MRACVLYQYDLSFEILYSSGRDNIIIYDMLAAARMHREIAFPKFTVLHLHRHAPLYVEKRDRQRDALYAQFTTQFIHFFR